MYMPFYTSLIYTFSCSTLSYYSYQVLLTTRQKLQHNNKLEAQGKKLWFEGKTQFMVTCCHTWLQVKIIVFMFESSSKTLI